MKTEQCEKCGKENDRADWSNYCTKCAESFHANHEKLMDEDVKAAAQFWAEKLNKEAYEATPKRYFK